MFQERSLLERLSKEWIGPSRTASEDIAALRSSIARNLQRIFSSRQGTAPAQMDFGVPDPTQIAAAYPDSIADMQGAIRACIEKYEPRLKDVKVSVVEDNEDILTLQYQVTGKLTTSKERVSISFDTHVDSTGHIEIHE